MLLVNQFVNVSTLATDSTQPTIASMLIKNGHALRLPNSGNG